MIIPLRNQIISIILISMIKNEKAEKRRKIRFPLDVEVNYMKKAMARTKNISESGICLIHEDPVEVGTIQHLTFHLPKVNIRFEAHGKIIWTRQATEHLYESGIEFWNIDSQNYEMLKEYFS